jgi:hypothetical protein
MKLVRTFSLLAVLLFTVASAFRSGGLQAGTSAPQSQPSRNSMTSASMVWACMSNAP